MPCACRQFLVELLPIKVRGALPKFYQRTGDALPKKLSLPKNISNSFGLSYQLERRYQRICQRTDALPKNYRYQRILYVTKEYTNDFLVELPKNRCVTKELSLPKNFIRYQRIYQ